MAALIEHKESHFQSPAGKKGLVTVLKNITCECKKWGRGEWSAEKKKSFKGTFGKNIFFSFLNKNTT